VDASLDRVHIARDALTGVMAYETMGRRGPRAASVAGVVLVLLALFVVSSGSWGMSPVLGLLWR
jgi:hypothetical protein